MERASRPYAAQMGGGWTRLMIRFRWSAITVFSGFVAGRMVTMQEFGIGLAAAIRFDATLIRAVLVPSLTALLGLYNWWLPSPLAKLVRVEPSPPAERGASVAVAE